MKSYKFIFKIDFNFNFHMLKHFGSILEKLHIATDAKPFEGCKYDINLANLSSKVAGTCQGNKFGVDFDLKAISGWIEFNDGISPRTISKHPLLDFVERSIEGMDSKPVAIERIGFRTYMLKSSAENSHADFDKIFRLLERHNSSFSTSISKSFGNINDIGITFEGKRPDGLQMRTSFGPYNRIEAGKYFFFEPSASEGLIMDIDIYEQKTRIEGFSFKQSAKKYSEYMEKLSLDLLNTIEKELASRETLAEQTSRELLYD